LEQVDLWWRVSRLPTMLVSPEFPADKPGLLPAFPEIDPPGGNALLNPQSSTPSL
jgi:hypothetical protein